MVIFRWGDRLVSRWLSGKEPARQCKRCEFDPWVRKIPWRRKWQPTPVFLPGESHGQSGLAGYNPQGDRIGHDLATKQQQTGSVSLEDRTRSDTCMCPV